MIESFFMIPCNVVTVIFSLLQGASLDSRMLNGMVYSQQLFALKSPVVSVYVSCKKESI
jgi:hypothetical protein